MLCSQHIQEHVTMFSEPWSPDTPASLHLSLTLPAVAPGSTAAPRLRVFVFRLEGSVSNTRRGAEMPCERRSCALYELSRRCVVQGYMDGHNQWSGALCALRGMSRFLLHSFNHSLGHSCRHCSDVCTHSLTQPHTQPHTHTHTE